MSCASGRVLLCLLLVSASAASDDLPACSDIPKVLCCTQRVIEKCLSGCIDYVTEKCPHKLAAFETIGGEKEGVAVKGAAVAPPAPRGPAHRAPAPVSIPATAAPQPRRVEVPREEPRRRAPQNGDYKFLNQEYPITEVSDADLTSECGTANSKPPFSPCLSRKTVDDVFLSCCQQHVPANCHSLCSYEHREHVAAEQLIQAVQGDGCDLKYLSNILYCAGQNRDNRPCCEQLGMNGAELGVGDRCLRMCNVGPSGDKISSVEKSDLVCLSNWNVLMYCARSGLRTIN